MRIGRAGTVGELDRAAWTRFADDAGITLTFLRRRAATLSEIIETLCQEPIGPEALRRCTALRSAAIRQSLTG